MELRATGAYAAGSVRLPDVAYLADTAPDTARQFRDESVTTSNEVSDGFTMPMAPTGRMSSENGERSMSELHYKPATELMALLDARELGSRELLDHFLDRVERHNPSINAIIWQDTDRARGEADASDRRRAAGEDTGPLDGLPVTVKESFDLAGSPTTWGVPE